MPLNMEGKKEGDRNSYHLQDFKKSLAAAPSVWSKMSQVAGVEARPLDLLPVSSKVKWVLQIRSTVKLCCIFCRIHLPYTIMSLPLPCAAELFTFRTL